MSTHTPPAPYPSLLRWFGGDAPDTDKIVVELVAMTRNDHYARLLSVLELLDEQAAFGAALQVSFPQLDVRSPVFPAPAQPLPKLVRQTLRSAGAHCLTSIALGEPRDAFSPLFFAEQAGELRYKKAVVHGTVQGQGARFRVGAHGRLYVASADHPLKCWIQKGGVDATAQHIVGVVPGGQAGGYTALSALGSSTWEHTFDGDLTRPEGLINVIAASQAFGAVTWDASYCTAGWVDSLMPTLSTRGTIPVPGGSTKIGQNVHSSTVVGSAWLPGLDDVDCKQDAFPAGWTAGVRASLCPRAAGHADLATITRFCGILKLAGFRQEKDADLEARIRYLLTHHPADKATLRKLPNINKYYGKLF
ncbi:hypothetical protein ABZY44_03065 [Streptomyces sp. NPDC006544]|uniref:hypothetical protein n=1 Tax=Streptomyces sp. NPDC006544 TaxID=3154583 RepID=UPI0033B4E3C3